jgi:hypothetical protein
MAMAGLTKERERRASQDGTNMSLLDVGANGSGVY